MTQKRVLIFSIIALAVALLSAASLYFRAKRVFVDEPQQQRALLTTGATQTAATGCCGEPLCVFDPPKSTNAINAPCYTIITAVATDDKGANAVDSRIIHFTPKPSPTVTPSPKPSATRTPVCSPPVNGVCTPSPPCVLVSKSCVARY